MDDHPSSSKRICDGHSSPSKRICHGPSSSSKCISITCSNNTNDGGNQTIINELINTKIVHNHSPVPSQTSPAPSQVPARPINYVDGGVSQNIDMILHRLQDPLFRPIGVWGMGGVGKTMLLRVLFNKLLEKPHIAGSAYWVKVPKKCSLYQLQEEIARAIGLKFYDEDDVERRADLLHHKLIEMKRVILILDDVWECFLEDEIGIPCGKSDCKMIFSTRLKEVCTQMGYDDYTVNVQPLGKDEAFELFCCTLKNYDELSAEGREIAPLVAEKCHCLPLAIKVIAASLSGKDKIHKWQHTLHQLKNLDIAHVKMEDKVHGVLRYSYDHLKGDKLKNFFLNCALYPEDHVISRKELIELLIMEGSLDNLRKRDMQLCMGHTMLDELVNSCLLEQCPDFPEDKVKMHDLIRDMAIIISSKEDPRFLVKSGLLLNTISGKDWNEDLVKASFSHNRIKEIPCGMSPYTPILTVLLLSDNCLLEIPESFFVHMKFLKVLDLTFNDIQRLPDSVSDLEDLRALLLGGCSKLKYVPSLSKLSKLRVLVLPFPDKEKWDLEEVMRGMKRLKSLEKLDYCQWKISDVNQFNSFIEFAQSLTYYTLVLGDGAFSMFEFYERRFYIRGGKFGDDNQIPVIPPTTELLFVKETKRKRVNNLVDVLPSLADLNQLKCLGVESCPGLRYIAIQSQDSSISHLETLEILRLKHLIYLKRVIKYGGYCFSHLKELKICNCMSLRVGLPIKSANHTLPLLPNLETINVSKCSKLTQIFETKDISSSSSGIHFDPILALPKLLTINLCSLPELGSIYRGLLLCTCLQNMQVTDCPGLNLLPLSKPLICSRWFQSRASIPKQEDRPDWWELLLNEYPEDARKLSKFKAFGSLDDDEVSLAHSIQDLKSDLLKRCLSDFSSLDDSDEDDSDEDDSDEVDSDDPMSMLKSHWKRSKYY